MHDTIHSNTTYYFKKDKEYKRILPGSARAYVKEDDYSKIFIDYWLTTPTYFPKGSMLITRSEGNEDKLDSLTKSERYRYYTIPDSVRENLKNIPKVIETLNNTIDSIWFKCT